MKEKVLAIKKLTFGYSQDKMLFKNFSLELYRGEIISIVGPSGIGKSTLFELIAGFLKPISGTIEVKKFSQIFQDPYTSFHPSYTIIDQISDVCDIEDIEKFASLIQIDYNLLQKRSHELSGGQLQRCSILRAIMMKPDLILADEPTSALDNIIQLDVMKLLLKLLDRVGILLITHDLSLAKWCSDRIIKLE